VTVAISANHAPIVWVAPFSNLVFIAVFCAALVTGQHLTREAVKCSFVYLFLHNCKYDNIVYAKCQAQKSTTSREQAAPLELLTAPTVGDFLTVSFERPRPEIAVNNLRHCERVVHCRVVNTTLTGEFFAAHAVGVFVFPSQFVHNSISHNCKEYSTETEICQA